MDPAYYESAVTSDRDTPIACPSVTIVNHGHYTITGIEAQLSTDGRSLMSYGKREHFSGLANIPQDLQAGTYEEPDVRLSTLTLTDRGLRFTHDAIADKFLHGSYPIVRWKDMWGQIWEHKLGVVRRIQQDEQWSP
jgi:hypothetical protein